MRQDHLNHSHIERGEGDGLMPGKLTHVAGSVW